jgi:hypothetical protein
MRKVSEKLPSRMGGSGRRGWTGQAGARLEEHTPELVPARKRLAGLLAGDPEAAAAPALWNPPPFLTGCVQAAELLADGTGASGVAAACLLPPLYATRFGQGLRLGAR